MGEFPEGIFEMPSARVFDYNWSWDHLIRSCLHSDPVNRPDNILTALDSVRTGARATLFTAPEEQKPEELPQSVENEIHDTMSIGNTLEKTVLKPVIHSAQLERPETDPDPASVFQIDSTVKYYVPERKENKNVQPLLTDMVVIVGGNFNRGSNDRESG